MRIIQSSFLASGGLIFYAAVASAATLGYTEGARSLVAATVAVADNADDSLPGFNLGTLSASGVDTINLFGRIETAHDIFQFQATSPFTVEFIFGGYDLAAGGHVGQSGFVPDPTVSGDPGNTSDFKLRITEPSDALLGDVIYTTPYTSGDPFIFGATATGTYRFRIDGGVDQELGGPAYYDIRISAAATPLPATLPLFAGGLSAIGLLGWRRKKRTAALAD